MPGVRAVITVADLDAAGIRNMPAAAAKASRRIADAAAAAAAAGDRSGSLCRRTDRDGRGGNQQAGQGRRRGGLRRYRPVARGHDRQRRGGAGRAAAARRSARECLPGFPLRRYGKGRGGVRPGGACDEVVDPEQSDRRLSDGAALGDRRIRCRSRSVHSAPRLPGRIRPAQSGQRHSRHSGREVARADRQCRRLVRHEGVRLSGIYLPAARRADAGPAGEMDRRAVGKLHVGQSRPRP